MKKFLINVLTFLIVMASTAGLVYLKKTDDYKKEVKKQSEQNQIEVVEIDPGAELFFAAVSDVLSRGVDLRVRVNVGSIPVTADVKMTIEPFAVHADIVAFGQGITLDYAGDEVYVSANEMKFVADIEDAANAVELLTSAFALSLPSIENPLSNIDFSEVASKVTASDLKIPYTDLGGGKIELALKLSDIGLDLSGLGLSTDFTAYLTVGGDAGEEKFLSARLDKISLSGVPEISVSATFGADEFDLPQVDTASYADLDAVMTQIAAFASGGVQANYALTALDLSVTGTLGYDVESGRAKLSAVSGAHALSAVYTGGNVFVDYGNMKFAVSPEEAANLMEGLGVQLSSIPQINFADIDIADIALKLLASQFKVDGDCYVVKTTIGGYVANVWFGAEGIEKIVVETAQLTLTLENIVECDSVALPEGEYYDIIALAQQGVDAYRYGATFDVTATYGDLSLSAAGKFRLDDAEVVVSAAVTAMEQTVDLVFDGDAVYLQTRGTSAFKAQISLQEIASLIPEGGMQLPEMATAVKTVLGMLPTIAMIAGENQTFTLSLTDVYGYDVSVVLSENGIAQITLTDKKDLSVRFAIGSVGTEQNPVTPLQPVDKDEYLPVSDLAEQVFDILENGIAFAVDANYDGMDLSANVTAVNDLIYLAIGNMKFTVGMDWVMEKLKSLPLPEIDVKTLVGALLGGAFGSKTDGYAYAFDVLGATVSLTFNGGAIDGVSIAINGASITLKDIVVGEGVEVPTDDYYDVANLIDQVFELIDGVTLNATAVVDGTTYQGITVTWYDGSIYVSLGNDKLKFAVSVGDIPEILTAMQSAFNFEMSKAGIDVASIVDKVLAATFNKVENNFVLELNDLFGVDASMTFDADGIASINATYGEYSAALAVESVVVPSTVDYIPVKNLALQVADIFDHGVKFAVEVVYNEITTTASIMVVNNTVYVAVGEMKFSLTMSEILNLVGETELPTIAIAELIDVIFDGYYGTNDYKHFSVVVENYSITATFSDNGIELVTLGNGNGVLMIRSVVAGESVVASTGDYYDVANLIDQVPELINGVTLGVSATVDGTTYQGITLTWYNGSVYLSLGENELQFKVSPSEIAEILSLFGVEMPSMDLDITELVNKVLGATFGKQTDGTFVLGLNDLFGVNASITFNANGVASVNATYGDYNANLTIGEVVAPTESEYLAVKELATQVSDIFEHGVKFTVDVVCDEIQATAYITVVNNTVYVVVGEMKFSLTTAEIMEMTSGTTMPALVIAEIIDTVLDGVFANNTYTLTIGQMTTSVSLANSKLSGASVTMNGASITLKDIVAGEGVEVPTGDYYDVANLIDQVSELIDGVTLNATAVVDGTTYQGITLTWYDGSIYVSLGDNELKFAVSVGDIPEIITAMQSAFNFEMSKAGIDVASIVDKVLAATFNKVENNFVLELNDLFGVDASMTFDADGIASINATYGEYSAALAVESVVVPSTADYIPVKNLALQVADIFDHGVSLAANVTYDGINVTASITVVDNTVYVSVGNMKFVMTLAEIMERVGGIGMPNIAITEILNTILDGTFANNAYSVAVGDVTATVTFAEGKLANISMAAYGASITLKDIVAGESVEVPAGDYYNVNNLIDQVFDAMEAGLTFSVGATYQDISLSASGSFRLEGNKPTASAVITVYDRTVSVYFDGTTVFVALGENGLKAKLTISEIPSILASFGIASGEEKLSFANIVEKVLAATFNKVENNFILTVSNLFGVNASIAFDEGGVANVTVGLDGINATITVLTVGNSEQPVTVGAVSDAQAYLDASGIAQTVADVLDGGVTASISATYQGRTLSGTVTYDLRGALNVELTYGEHNLIAVYENGTLYVIADNLKLSLSKDKVMEVLSTFGIQLPSGGQNATEIVDYQSIVQKAIDATFVKTDSAFDWSMAMEGFTITLTVTDGGQLSASVTGTDFIASLTSVTAGGTVASRTETYYNANNLVDQVVNAYQNGIETSFDVKAMGYALSGSIVVRYQESKIGAVLTIDTISRLAEDGTVAYTHAQPITVTYADGTLYVAVGENGLKVKLTVAQIKELIPTAQQTDNDEGTGIESIVLQVISSAFESKQDGSYVLTVLDLMGMDLTLTFSGNGITAIGVGYGEITAGLSGILSATENSAVSMPTVGNAADYVDGADLITQVTDIAGGGMTAQVGATFAGNEVSGSVQISLENGIAVRANLTIARENQTVALEVHYVNEKIYVSVPSTGLKLVATQDDIKTLISDVSEIATFFTMSITVEGGGITTTTDELIDGVMNGTQQTVTGGYVLSLSILGLDFGITFDHSGILQITVAQKEINATLSGVSANSGNFDGTVAGESEYTSLSAITAMTGGMLATMNKKAFAITDSVVKLPGITANIKYLNIQLAEEAGKNFFETLGDRLMEIDADLSVTMGSKTHTLKLWYEYVAGATSGDGKTLFIEFDTLKLKMADSSMFGIIASVCQLMGQPLPDFLLEFLEDPENSDIFNQGGIGGGEGKPLDIDIPALLNMFVSLSFEQNGSASIVLDSGSKMLSSLNLNDNLSINVTMVTDGDGVTTLGGITASDGTAQTLNADLTLSAQSTVALDVLTLDEAKAYVDITPIKELLDSFLGTANKPDRATPSSTVKLATGETATTKNFYIEGDLKMSMKVIVGSINVNIKLYADILLTTIRDGNGNFLRQEVEAYVRSENDRTYLLGYGVFKGTGEIYYDNSIKENVNGQQKSVLYLSRNQDEKTSSWGSAKNKQYRKRIDMSYLGNTENAIRTIGLFFGMTGSMQQAIIDGVANANYTTDLTKLFAPLQQFDGKDGRPSDVNGNTQFYGYQPASSSSAGGHEIAINTFALTGENMLKDLSILFGISHDNATNTDYIGSLNMKYYIELLGSSVTCTITTPNGGFKHTIGGTCPSSKTSCEGFGVLFTDQGGKGNFTEAVQYIA